MRSGTKNQRKTNETLKLEMLDGREMTAAELDQVAGGWCSPGPWCEPNP